MEKDLDGGFYIASVKAGVANSNLALVVAAVEGRKISLAACAKEGPIKQSTAKKAIGRIMKAAKQYTDSR